VVRSVTFAVPGALTIPTGGYTYDRRIIEELSALGWQVETLNLGEGFPRPSAELRAAARERLAAQPSSRPIVIDGLAFGVLPEVASDLRTSHYLIALVHHPLALEAGLAPGEANALRTSEREALAGARKVITTSGFTARLLASYYGVPVDRMTVVRPGNDPIAPARRPFNGEISLLSVGAVVPRKGYDVLIAALASLRDLPWHLTIVGDRTREVETAALLDCTVTRCALCERITFAGAVSTERLAAFYARADLFVLASRFEGYGMAFAEAIAHGLPIVGTTAGAVVETVPASAGILVEPDDVSALSNALRLVITQPVLRDGLATAARSVAAGLPTWRQSAELFSHVLVAGL
jgi:glycosyltransferase involved in cell wall biosynthesis